MRLQILATFPAATLHAFYAWEGQVRVPRRAIAALLTHLSV